ncbi:hypothetical protein [Shewanella insulae]|uniref:hypothetical protein n=1 Tax=Shewanella insulae TaxID=2681496 RepID=UPI00247FC9CA|nr:hypothetical protein [Shewanella insulae]
MIKVKGVSQVSGRDYRLAESCLRVMSSKGFQVPQIASSGAEAAKLINQAIASQDWSNEEKDKAVRLLLDEAKQSLLPLGELDWIQSSDRASYWVWVTLSRYQFCAAPNPPVFQPVQGQQPLLTLQYNQLNLKASPSSSKERFEEVVKFFDRVAQPIDWQRALVAHLKFQWSQIFSVRKPFSWLKQDNEEQIRWAWEYLSKMNWGTSKPSVVGFSPTGCQEMYLAIYAAFDSWDAAPDSRRLFLSDFNKAWQQKKHRDSRQGKKACNLVLREEVKQKLDDMAAARGMKLNQFVEALIESEHAKMS